MIAFPRYIQGRVSTALPEGEERRGMDAMLNIIRDALVNAKARSVVMEGGDIQFRGGRFRYLPSASLLAGITSGTVSAEAGTGRVLLHYRLDRIEALVVGTLVCFAVGLGIGRSGEWLLGLLAFVWLWISLVAFGYAMGALRFKRFMRQAAELGTKSGSAASERAP